MPDDLPRGHTPREVAKILRVSPDRVRTMIQAGELGAVNLARHRCGRPRYVVLPCHLEEFVRARRVEPPARPASRRKGQAELVDYLEDV
jgi:excisionase family DNA binding protein